MLNLLLIFLGLSAQTDYDIIKIFGNSMEPYLFDGQTSIVDFKKIIYL